MSISYNGSITLATSTMTDGVIDPTNNQLYVVEITGPSMRKFNLQTLAQVGSNITCLANPGVISLINAASSVIGSTSSTTIDFVENATGYRTNQAGSAVTILNTLKGQRMASDTSNGIALACTSSSNTILKITSAQTSTALSIKGMPNFLSECIIFKSTGRFLIAGKFGKVYEIDTSGNIIDELTVTLDPNTGLLANTSDNALDLPTIYFISYDNNLLTVTTDESVSVYDYSTKTKLWQHQMNQTSGGSQMVLCAASSGETLMSRNSTLTASSPVTEFNFTTYGPQQGDTLFTDNANLIFCTGFAPGLSYGWALHHTIEKIRVFTVSAPSTTTQTVTLPSPYLSGRLIVLDDTSGVGTVKRVLDTYCLSGNTYRLPTGKTLIGITKMYNGTNAFWCEARIST